MLCEPDAGADGGAARGRQAHEERDRQHKLAKEARHRIRQRTCATPNRPWSRVTVHCAGWRSSARLLVCLSGNGSDIMAGHARPRPYALPARMLGLTARPRARRNKLLINEYKVDLHGLDAAQAVGALHDTLAKFSGEHSAPSAR